MIINQLKLNHLLFQKMQRLLTLLIISLLGLFYSNFSYAQKNIKFERVTVDQGLSQSNINCILQDHKGFLWIGTNGGLNRYDGTEFKGFLYNASDTNTISSNIINHIYEDDQGKLWISTQNGLNIYNPSIERFTTFKSEKDGNNCLSSNHITCVTKDNKNNYWIGTYGGGLNKYDPETNKFTVYRYFIKNPQSISGNYVTSLKKDKYGYIWAGTENSGLNMLDPETGKFIRYMHYPDNPQASKLNSNSINTIYEDNDGDLWVGTAEGIHLIKPKKSGRDINGTDIVIDYSKISPLVENKSISCIIQGISGLLWFGTNNNGLIFINKYTGQAGNYLFDPKDEFSLLSNTVKSVYDDKAGILWIGTNAGINIIDRQGIRFNLVKRIPGAENTLSSNNVQSILKDNWGTIWIGTYDGGLNKYVPYSGSYTNYLANDYIEDGESYVDRSRILEKFNREMTDFNKSKIQYLSNNRIYALHKDKLNRLWIGTGGGGLNMLNVNTGKIIHYKSDIKNESGLNGNIVRTLFEDSYGNLWIGTQDGGINCFNKEKFMHFSHDANDQNSISSDDVRSITEDSDKNIWIGTFGGGLNMLDHVNNQFIHYQYEEGDPTSISSNTIYSLYHDDSSRLWIGTTDGLNMLDLRKRIPEFHKFTIDDGLPSNFIYDILDDKHGNLWISSNKGISKFNISTGVFSNYDKKDGLQGSEFNPGAAYITDNGEMLFGGLNGFNTFYSDQIDDNEYIPDVVITDFRILNEEVPIGVAGSPLKKHISETDTLILSHKDLSISFEFVALNFTDSEKNEYEYKMENFDAKWNKAGNRRYANYTNLGPGEYVFRVRASNNDGVWNEEGTSIFIIIKPPFWRTIPFFIGSFLFISLSIYLIILARTRQLHKSKVLLEQQVKARTKLIEQQKSEVEKANKEIILQKDEIEKQRDLLVNKNQEITIAKKELDETNEELMAINTNLENIVEDRTASIRKINEELTKANNELDLFIYRASHDLKGPISRLLGLTLLAKMDNQDNELKEYIDIIQKGAIDMNKVLNKLNNIHFINREKIEYEEINLAELVEECKSSLANYMDLKDLSLKLTLEPGIKLISDKKLLTIIFENIIENAIIFRKFKKIHVDIIVTSSDEYLNFSIEDQGVGLSQEIKDKMFDMFYRGSTRSKGNGLGLYLVKRSINKLRGKISVESEQGIYTCITVSIPKETVPASILLEKYK